MKIILTFLFCLSIKISLAETLTDKNSDVEVFREDKSIYLSAFNCEDIQNELVNIKKWSKQDYTQPSTQKCECLDGFCKLNITNEIPEIVRLYEEKRPEVNGPNCWNNTLVTTGILPHLRYSSPEEMEFWMKSPLCQEKKITDKMEPGDVIAIREKDSQEYHGFVYISEKMAWSKNGFNKKNLYNVQNLIGVFDIYGVKTECQRNVGNTKQCKKYANVYKCKSWDEYWKNVDESIKARVDENIEHSINQIECSLSESLFNKALIDKKSMDLMFNSLAIVEILVQDIKENLDKDASEDEKLYIDRALQRILSIKEQYYLMEDSF